jgi:type II secretory pathway pseudopilin PulG
MDGCAGRQRGFTYIGLLLAVAVMGLVLMIAAQVWSTTEQRERETQLLFVGDAYRLAIGGYFAAGHHFPQPLQDLLVDERTPVPRPSLRRLYSDLMTGKADWTLVLTADGRASGVASARGPPIKRRNFTFRDRAFSVPTASVCGSSSTLQSLAPGTGGRRWRCTLTPANTQSHPPARWAASRPAASLRCRAAAAPATGHRRLLAGCCNQQCAGRHDPGSTDNS